MIPAIKNCAVKKIKYREAVEEFAKYSSNYYSCILTGKGNEDIASQSFIGIFPHTIIRYKNNSFEIETENGTKNQGGDFWDFLKKIYTAADFSRFKYPANLCGAIGYISYEAYHLVEKINPMTEESYSLPVLEIVFYNQYAYFNHKNKRAYQVTINYSEPGCLNHEKTWPIDTYSVKNLSAECTMEEYTDRVKKIIDYIVEGDVYEVCLTQQFNADFKGNPFLLFKNIFKNNPAPFSSFLNFNDSVIISNSPELFLRCSGNRVETRPIKGTAPRGKTGIEDKKNMEALLSSAKEEAELYMIIDLLRNDIGKVCKTGSVKVLNKKRIEAYENVFQLIGIVEGRLAKGMDYIDLLRATFPGGSITGCPKIRSIEIIEELETFKRNIYTGSIFLMNKKSFISNIAIRTVLINGGKMFFNSGGAITIGSNPDNEYKEIMHKVENIMSVSGYDAETIFLKKSTGTSF